jgi:hypothetical protein
MPKVERFIEIYLDGLEHGSELSHRSQVHEDNTFTWALALMGGALLALPSTLQALDLHVEWTRWGYLLACAPWAVGSISAVFGRFCIRKLRNADDGFTFHKTAHVTSVLLKDDPESAGDEVRQIVNDEVGRLAELKKAVSVWGKWSTIFFYTTHSLLVLGFLTISAFIIWRTLCR